MVQRMDEVVNFLMRDFTVLGVTLQYWIPSFTGILILSAIYIEYFRT